LNDSQVHEIKASFEAQTLIIVLNGEYTDENNNQLGLRRFFLNYKSVTWLQINEGAETATNPGPDADPQNVSLFVRGGYGIAFDDHGWDEIELIEDDLFEHRMLFSSGTETVVCFRDFTLSYADTPHTPTRGKSKSKKPKSKKPKSKKPKSKKPKSKKPKSKKPKSMKSKSKKS
jgi:cell division septation protein DedD